MHLHSAAAKRPFSHQILDDPTDDVRTLIPEPLNAEKPSDQCRQRFFEDPELILNEVQDRE
jgi:hypothetical protein